MTHVTFFICHGKPVGFEAVGHSDYADEGSDIVCAAVSAVTQVAAVQAENVLNMKGAVMSDERKALLRVRGEGGKSWEDLLAATELFLTELAAQYPEHLKIHTTEV